MIFHLYRQDKTNYMGEVFEQMEPKPSSLQASVLHSWQGVRCFSGTRGRRKEMIGGQFWQKAGVGASDILAEGL